MRWVITMKIDRLRADFEKIIGAPPYEYMCDRAGGEAAWPGQYKRYETQLAWNMWHSATQRCIDIIERYQVPTGNSAAGEMACKWTMNALRQIRDEIAGDLDDED